MPAAFQFPTTLGPQGAETERLVAFNTRQFPATLGPQGAETVEYPFPNYWHSYHVPAAFQFPTTLGTQGAETERLVAFNTRNHSPTTGTRYNGETGWR